MLNAITKGRVPVVLNTVNYILDHCCNDLRHTDKEVFILSSIYQRDAERKFVTLKERTSFNERIKAQKSIDYSSLIFLRRLKNATDILFTVYD